ncbi:hypothetical protein HaLaN_24121 [Haematococcus lacustris]|uniref:EF-hand domain-containing protein n=1 Tax=Haematococcus lacustris TaxID=44745 RepID=A0A6A0A2H3_HAELA|nr:hypothetical protein HaLaN_24121 [Haematococcus lacustris]
MLAGLSHAFQVLHATATKLGSYATLSDFWLQYAHLDKRRLGRISIDAATTLLVKSLPELPAPDVELVLAYLGAALWLAGWLPWCRDVVPHLTPSQLQLFSALADFDGDSHVSVEDLQQAGRESFEPLQQQLL